MQLILHKNELKKYSKQLPDDVLEKVKEYLLILDETYGKNRVATKTGGFVAIIENAAKDFSTLNERFFLDTNDNIPEIVDDCGHWRISMYIVGTEFAIITVERLA